MRMKDRGGTGESMLATVNIELSRKRGNESDAKTGREIGMLDNGHDLWGIGWW